MTRHTWRCDTCQRYVPTGATRCRDCTQTVPLFAALHALFTRLQTAQVDLPADVSRLLQTHRWDLYD